ncbi:DEAD/DEAH box helicase, partial [Streptomyces sp. NPDC000851]
MSRARTKRTYDRFGGSATNRSSASNRSSGAPRRSKGSKGSGGRQSAPQGDFALPVTTTPALPAVESFADLALPAPLLATLGHEGVTVPFPIQAATLPNSLAGRDVLGRGRTGSGKTLAFGLAALARTAGRRAEP